MVRLFKSIEAREGDWRHLSVLGEIFSCALDQFNVQRRGTHWLLRDSMALDQSLPLTASCIDGEDRVAFVCVLKARESYQHWIRLFVSSLINPWACLQILLKREVEVEPVVLLFKLIWWQVDMIVALSLSPVKGPELDTVTALPQARRRICQPIHRVVSAKIYRAVEVPFVIPVVEYPSYHGDN